MSGQSLQDSWKVNRRDFVKGAAMTTAGSWITGESLAQTSGQATRPPGESRAGAGKVPEKPLGRTGVNVSALGVGGYHHER
jgi:hypothetical protein